MSALFCTCLAWYLGGLISSIVGNTNRRWTFYSIFCILDAGDNPFKSDGLDLNMRAAGAGDVSQEGHKQPGDSRDPKIEAFWKSWKDCVHRFLREQPQDCGLLFLGACICAPVIVRLGRR